ncbi:nucleoside triphosphate pyrophosphatase, partial [Treponema sp.]|uniref:Maf family protein n=1 Tax=Treponema sp. TaxID=166 RepID=UPI0025EF8CAB
CCQNKFFSELILIFLINCKSFIFCNPADINVMDVSSWIAKNKALAVYEKYKNQLRENLILAADTVICFNNQVLGKPADRTKAAEYIALLQGKTHQAVTSLALYNIHTEKLSIRKAVCNVKFAPMNKEEIEWYLSTGEWQGAAGAYKIQGKASLFIEKIEGTDSCVMGLPLFELYDILREHNYSFF